MKGNASSQRAFSYRLLAQEPLKTSGGTVRIVDSSNFPAASTIAAALVEVEPGAMREMHWYPTNDEWQYYIEGSGPMTVFASEGKARTFDYQAGDVGYVPFAMGHYVENTGDTVLRFLEMFKSPRFADVSLNQWMPLTPPDAVLVFLVGVTFGSFCLGRAPQQQSGTAWHQTFARYLLMEWLLLLVYAIIWRVTSHLSQQAGVQVLLLCVAALGMGIQGALVWTFKIPGVVADALTATVILLGQRFAQGLEHPGPESREWRWSSLFLALLCLVYVTSALVVALISAFILTPVVPVIVVTIAIFALLVPARQAV